MRRNLMGASLLLAIATVLAPALPSIAHGGYSLESLKGRWAFVERYHVGQAPGTAMGLYTFDGAGKCTYRGTEHGWIYSEATEIRGGCTYSISKSGQGEISGAPMVDTSFVLTAHGHEIRYIFTGERGYFGSGRMIPADGRYSSANLSGRWSFIENYQLGDAYGSAVGQVRFDGDGGCAERWVEHGGTASYGPSGPGKNWVDCTYAVDQNGLGVITGGFVDQHFVVADTGNTIFFIDADEMWPGYYGDGEMRRL